MRVLGPLQACYNRLFRNQTLKRSYFAAGHQSFMIAYDRMPRSKGNPHSSRSSDKYFLYLLPRTTYRPRIRTLFWLSIFPSKHSIQQSPLTANTFSR